MIHFKCPHCSKGIKVSETNVGKKGKCPGCGATICVPRAVALDDILVKCEDGPTSMASPPDVQVQSTENVLTQTLELYWPTIRDFVIEKAGPAAKSIAQNDDQMKTALAAAYQVMPLPLRLLVSNEQFAAFWLDRRDRIFDAMQSDDPPLDSPLSKN